jgi:hypothetical protein
MELTVDIIIAVATAIVTAIFGTCAKKFNWATQDYIPYQNIVIGIIAGILVFATGLNTNILYSLILCIFSATAAGGIYDATKTK